MIVLQPIGIVRSQRQMIEDGYWGGMVKGFLPQGEIKQPIWSEELMKNYWWPR
jgi:hypothetical protein